MLPRAHDHSPPVTRSLATLAAAVLISASGFEPIATVHPVDPGPPAEPTVSVTATNSRGPVDATDVQAIRIIYPDDSDGPDRQPAVTFLRDFPGSPPVPERPVTQVPQPDPGVAVKGATRTLANGSNPCGYGDVLTEHRAYDEWPLTLVDTVLMVPRSYAPTDLVSTTRAGVSGGLVRSFVIPDLKAMGSAARAAGVPLAIESGYRSYASQRASFNMWVSRNGLQRALMASARPGHSEHQLGVAIDFTGVGDGEPWKLLDWGRTPTGRWLAQNAWQYGFVMSYPPGLSPSKTCYKYEPWHFRYMGRDEAARIHASGLAPREWLLVNVPA